MTATRAHGVSARVTDVTFYGHDTAVHLDLLPAGPTVVARIFGAEVPERGAVVGLEVGGAVTAFRRPPRPTTNGQVAIGKANQISPRVTLAAVRDLPGAGTSGLFPLRAFGDRPALLTGDGVAVVPGPRRAGRGRAVEALGPVRRLVLIGGGQPRRVAGHVPRRAAQR